MTDKDKIREAYKNEWDGDEIDFYLFKKGYKSRDTSFKELEEEVNNSMNKVDFVTKRNTALQNQNKLLRDALELIQFSLAKSGPYGFLTPLEIVKLKEWIQEALSKTGGNDEV